MTNTAGCGGLKIGPLVMKQFEKVYFDTSYDAMCWILDTIYETDGEIRREDNNGKWYVFTKLKPDD